MWHSNILLWSSQVTLEGNGVCFRTLALLLKCILILSHQTSECLARSSSSLKASSYELESNDHGFHHPHSKQEGKEMQVMSLVHVFDAFASSFLFMTCIVCGKKTEMQIAQTELCPTVLLRFVPKEWVGQPKSC